MLTLKNLLLTAVFSLITFLIYAQTDTTSNWKRSFSSGLNFNQASFSDNWKGGGVNSIALGSFLNARANYESEELTFSNELDLLYGIQKNKDQSARKTTDRIFFDSKLGYKLSPVWSAFVSVNFLSQFDLGYRYTDSLGEERRALISKFFSPAYLTSSLGFEYKPKEYFWMRFGVGTFRQTFVGDKNIYRDEPLNYGVPIGKRVRNELALQYIANLDKDIAQNLNLKARFTAFANYETLDAIDTRLDVILTAKINKFVNVNLTGTALYDQDMDYKIQYSQSLALGILYNFSEFPVK
ncbi:MAG TPA: DUF3078 domain-containing protein [Cytophagales bacterium]|nr:DUF3078 domain-containing protein [Cytophagales bacterium]